jgi:hypothetical protein
MVCLSLADYYISMYTHYHQKLMKSVGSHGNYSHCGCDEGDEGLTLFVSFSQKVMTALIVMLTFILFVMEISVQFYVLDSS